MKKIIYISKKVTYECHEYVNGYLFWYSLASTSYRKILPKYFKVILQARKIHLLNFLEQSVFGFYSLGKKALLSEGKKTQTYVRTNIEHSLFHTAFQFKKIIGLKGVGYKFLIYKNLLRLQVDYSHLLQMRFLSFYYGQFNRKLNWMRIKSAHIFSLSSDMAVLRRLRRPDVYKGKGIRYAKEIRSYKQGKKKKSV